MLLAGSLKTGTEFPKDHWHFIKVEHCLVQSQKRPFFPFFISNEKLYSRQGGLEYNWIKMGAINTVSANLI